MKLVRVVLGILFLISTSTLSSALPEIDTGDGGYGVFSYGDNNKIKSIEFFDLWYANQQLQVPLITSKLKTYDLGRQRIIQLFEADRPYFEGLLESYANVQRAIVLLAGTDLELIPPTAFLGNLAFVKNAKRQLMPLATYSDTGHLLIVERNWKAFAADTDSSKNVHEAAFYVHEAIGNILRKAMRGQMQAAKKIKDGEALPKEVKEVIARDSVHLTALAFADFTAKQLKRKVRQYRQTGKILMKKPLERFNISRTLRGDCVKTFYEANENMKKTCEGWKESIATDLTPRSEFVLAECTPQLPDEVDTPG